MITSQFNYPFSEEIKQEPISSEDDDFFTPFSASRILPKKRDLQIEEIKIKIEPKIEITEDIQLPPAPVPTKTFDGNWSSSDESDDGNFNVDMPDFGNSSSSDSDDKPLITLKKEMNASSNGAQVEKIKTESETKSASKNKKKSKKKAKKSSKAKLDPQSIFPDTARKRSKLTGKNACKYCETVFKDKAALVEHVCKYLTSDKKNFICRICNKELSKGTFSNHHHELSECPYCEKEFVNPRNMKRHIRNAHALDFEMHTMTEPDKPFVPWPYVKVNQYSQKREKLECGGWSPPFVSFKL